VTTCSLQSYAVRFHQHLTPEMYDKILRHRHTIEAHLAEAAVEHGSLSGRGDNASAVRLELLDHNQLLVYADSQPDLDKANQIIGSVINEGDLGLTGLTSLAKMAASSGTTAAASAAAAKHVPLGNAASWDAATRPRDIDEATKQLLESALPQEIGLQSHLSQWIMPSNHTQVTRAASDSYVQHMQQVMVDFSRLVVAAAPTSTTMTMTSSSSEASSNRRKLESEDSSYGSDNEHPKDQTIAHRQRPIATAQVWNASGGSGSGSGSGHNGSHEDISRTVSETLAVEFSEYVDQGALDQYDSIEDVTRDKAYENNLVFALKLGYTEPQLQKALLKLGKKAREDQILEELIRIQKSSKATVMCLDDPLLPSDDSKRYVASHLAAAADAEIDAMQSNEALLLPIIIDGSNVAMSHGNKERFSCRGIKICVDWFRSRGHKEITVFVPMWRKESSKPETPTTDQHILTELEKEKKLSFTPSRQVLGRRYVCHDDRYILNLAAENGGIVVSNDNYRELINEKPKFKEVIEERILMYSFVNDRFMPPDDPLGKNGPTLDQFLRKKVKLPCPLPQPCPYGKKCTYGNKCKFYHPDRAINQKSITEKLKEHSSVRINEVRARVNSRDSSPGDPLTRTRSMQPKQDNAGRPKQAVSRTKSSVPRLEHQWGSAAAAGAAQWPPVFDTSMPPPPPRTPWNPEQGSSQNTHTKLSRQYSVNPNYDPRIHNQPPRTQDFSYPPPPFQSNPSATHLTVTRNASEPDPYVMVPNTVIQQQQGSNPQQTHEVQAELCKTWSTPNATPSANAPGPAAASPFFGLPHGGVWETSRPHGDVRSKLYYYLAKLFDEDAVIRAMASLPHETDPKVICNLIISMESSNATTSTPAPAAGNGNAQI